MISEARTARKIAAGGYFPSEHYPSSSAPLGAASLTSPQILGDGLVAHPGRRVHKNPDEWLEFYFLGPGKGPKSYHNCITCG